MTTAYLRGYQKVYMVNVCGGYVTLANENNLYEMELCFSLMLPKYVFLN